ncbi:MAG: hypothetical protein AB7E39_00750 [Endomicrobiaceae bacterium]
MQKESKPNYRLLMNEPSNENATTYYFSGVRYLNSLIGDIKEVPLWLKKTMQLTDDIYTTFDKDVIKNKIKLIFAHLKEGKICSIPSFLAPWDKIINVCQNASAEPMILPASHLLKVLVDNESSIPNFDYPKIILGIIFGDIAATIYKAKLMNKNNDFENEFKAVFVNNPNIKTIFDLYNMFKIASDIFLKGYIPQLLGTDSKGTKAPDIVFEDKLKSFKYYLEATRKEPSCSKPEKDLVWDAIKEKVKKILPSKNNKWEPCIIAIDITCAELASSKESLDPNNIIQKDGTGYIYKCFKDQVFNERLKKMDNSLSVSAVLVAYYRSKKYSLAGVLASKKQLLRINNEGIAQVEGDTLILHKDFESEIPLSIATNIFLVDSSCIPDSFRL